jgi:hypothetical protein
MNPGRIEYLEEVKAIRPARDGLYGTKGLMSEMYKLEYRSKLVLKYSFAIPDATALKIIAKYSPLVEIGAGGGYWARLLREKGATIHAYDEAPPGSDKKNHWNFAKHLDVQHGLPSVLAEEPYNNGKWALFLCWPFMDAMAWQCLKSFAGDTVIYIGEGQGGCTANDEFFEVLTRDYEEIESHGIPQWFGIHDYLEVYRKK